MCKHIENSIFPIIEKDKSDWNVKKDAEQIIKTSVKICKSLGALWNFILSLSIEAFLFFELEWNYGSSNLDTLPHSWYLDGCKRNPTPKPKLVGIKSFSLALAV